ncbi:MAG TPA: histidine kinase, partial [Rubrivivax sp.]|nr:histidine kinase [Rubrivivax sp.]
MAASLPQAAAEPGRGDDPAFQASGLERMPARASRPRWPGWRRRALVLTALLGCIAVLWLARWVAATPFIDARWDADPAGSPRLASSSRPDLQAHLGRSLVAVGGRGVAPRPVDAALLHRSPRWQVNDAARERQVAQHEGVAATLAAGPARLYFADGSVAELAPAARGWAGLGGLFWPLAALAWLLLICGMAVLLARPHRLDLPYATMASCQAGNLLYIALETMPGLGLPAGVMAHELLVRMALDGVTGAAAVTSLALHPLRLPGARWIGAAACSAVAAWLALAWAGALSPLWWWAQALCLALAAAALATVAASYRTDPHPHAMVMRRFAAVALSSLGLVTVAVALAADLPLPVTGIAAGASIAWYLFLSSLLLLIPFLVRSRQMPREFMLLAGVATIATSLDLLFAAVFALEGVASLALALSIAFVLYGQARRWMLKHAAGRGMPSTERTFELLYRAARELQARPGHYPQLLKRLLRELFEPLEVSRAERVPTRTRVVGDGSALVVPVREGDDGVPTVALMLRYAQQGRRLFTQDDARLVDRVIEQMWRAVAYDQAVERGRHEERLRIAQDLHDDIGA